MEEKASYLPVVRGRHWKSSRRVKYVCLWLMIFPRVEVKYVCLWLMIFPRVEALLYHQSEAKCCIYLPKFFIIRIFFFFEIAQIMKSVKKKFWESIKKKRKCNFSLYIFIFFHFDPYILILPLLVPKPINACYFRPFRQSTNENIWQIGRASCRERV